VCVCDGFVLRVHVVIWTKHLELWKWWSFWIIFLVVILCNLWVSFFSFNIFFLVVLFSSYLNIRVVSFSSAQRIHSSIVYRVSWKLLLLLHKSPIITFFVMLDWFLISARELLTVEVWWQYFWAMDHSFVNVPKTTRLVRVFPILVTFDVGKFVRGGRWHFFFEGYPNTTRPAASNGFDANERE